MIDWLTISIIQIQVSQVQEASGSLAHAMERVPSSWTCIWGKLLLNRPENRADFAKATRTICRYRFNSASAPFFACSGSPCCSAIKLTKSMTESMSTTYGGSSLFSMSSKVKVSQWDSAKLSKLNEFKDSWTISAKMWVFFVSFPCCAWTVTRLVESHKSLDRNL